jgi:hypothetical protein
LTLQEHAEAHWILHFTHKRWQDKLAAQALEGWISAPEASYEMLSNGGKVGGKIGGKFAVDSGQLSKDRPTNPNHPKHKEHQSLAGKSGGKALSDLRKTDKELDERLKENSRRNGRNSKKLVEEGKHNFCINHPSKRQFMCVETGRITNKTTFTRFYPNATIIQI